MKKEMILITGVDGFTGQHAMAHFTESGYECIGVSRRIGTKLSSIKTCDLTNKEQVEELVKASKPDYILHLAGINSVEQCWNDPVTTIETNLLSTLYLLDAVRTNKLNTKILVITSLLQAPAANITTIHHAYGLSKTFQSLLLRAWHQLYEIDCIIAKPSNLIGPGTSKGICSILAEQIVSFERGKIEENNIIKINNLYAERDFLDVRDAVKAYEILLQKGEYGKEYDIATGKTYSINQIINKYKNLTPSTFSIISDVNLVERSPAASITAMRALGFVPKIGINKSLQDTLQYFRNHHYISY